MSEQEKSLLAAIEGDYNGMSKTDLVHTCKMLERGRAQWRQEAEEFAIALRESLKFQAHYGKLLNQWDGGERVTFETTVAWLERLREIGTLPRREGK